MAKASQGLELDSDELDFFYKSTGRKKYPVGNRYREIVINSGGRSGKTLLSAAITLFNVLYGEHNLAKGETGVGLIVASDAQQSTVNRNYIASWLQGDRDLMNLTDEILSKEIRFKNNTIIKCFPLSRGAVAAWSIISASCDELAQWSLKGSSEADRLIVDQIIRGMLSKPDAQLWKTSTRYKKSGLLYSDYTESYAKEDLHRLYFFTSTTAMRPDIPKDEIENLKRTNPAAYDYMYGDMWYSGEDQFIDNTIIENAIIRGRNSIAPEKGVRYLAGIDPAGGASMGDSYTCAIVRIDDSGSHSEAPRVIQVAMVGFKPKKRSKALNLDEATAGIARLLKSYGISRCYTDSYKTGYVQMSFAKHGIQVIERIYSNRTDLYLQLELLISQGRLEMLDHSELELETKSLQRKVGSNGSVKVVHPRAISDDHVNALALISFIATDTGYTNPNAVPVLVSSVPTATTKTDSLGIRTLSEAEISFQHGGGFNFDHPGIRGY